MGMWRLRGPIFPEFSIECLLGVSACENGFSEGIGFSEGSVRMQAVQLVAPVVAVGMSVAACGLRNAERAAAGLWVCCVACGAHEVG